MLTPRASIGPRSFNRGNDFMTGHVGASVGASIGPRSFNRGNTSHHSRLRRPISGFNRAAVFQPRKPPLTTAMPTWQLRFNRAAVFQPRKPAGKWIDAETSYEASIGPRSFNRGNHGIQ